MASNYVSKHSGSQIDQAYEAIAELPNTSATDYAGSIITFAGKLGAQKGPVLSASTKIDKVALKPTQTDGGTYKFVSADSDGNLYKTAFTPESFISRIDNPTASYVPLMTADGQLYASAYNPTVWVKRQSSWTYNGIGIFNNDGDIVSSTYTLRNFMPTIAGGTVGCVPVMVGSEDFDGTILQTSTYNPAEWITKPTNKKQDGIAYFDSQGSIYCSDDTLSMYIKKVENKVGYVPLIADGGGLTASDYDPTNWVTKPTRDSGYAGGNFATVNSDGTMSVSSYNNSSFIPQFTTYITGHIPTITSTGYLASSDYTVESWIPKITSPTANYVPIMTSSGYLSTSSYNPANWITKLATSDSDSFALAKKDGTIDRSSYTYQSFIQKITSPANGYVPLMDANGYLVTSKYDPTKWLSNLGMGNAVFGTINTSGGLERSTYTADSFLQKFTSFTTGHIPTITSTGYLASSDYTPSSFISKITSPTANYVPLMNSDGSLSTSTYDPAKWLTNLGTGNEVFGMISITGGLTRSSYTASSFLQKFTSFTTDHIPTITSSGYLASSNYSVSSWIPKITSPTANYVPVMSSDGYLSTSNYNPANWITKLSSATEGTIPLLTSSGTLKTSSYTASSWVPAITLPESYEGGYYATVNTDGTLSVSAVSPGNGVFFEEMKVKE